jgi:HK97 gp10 family phage protein
VARILTTLPGKTHTEEFSAKRIASQVGRSNTAKVAAQIVAERMQQRIKNGAPYETGELERSVTARIVLGGANPRVEVKTVTHGAYQEHGTTVLPPQPFIAPVVTSGRSDWEADLRATKANLDKRAAAAEAKERGRERDR